MDDFLWISLVSCAIAALSLWYIYPEKTWFVLALFPLITAGWFLHGAPYLLWFLPLVLMAAAIFFFQARDRGKGEPTENKPVAWVLTAICATVPVLWFAGALRGMPDTLKLRPSDTPPPGSTATQFWTDLKVHPEAWLLYAPLLILFAFAAGRLVYVALKSRNGKPGSAER